MTEAANQTFTIGQRVELLNCTRCAAGTVTAVNKKRVEVVFDDLSGQRWLLRAESLRLVKP